MAIDFADELLPRPRQLAHGGNIGRGHEAPANQPVSVKVREPRRVVDVALPSRKVFDLGGIGERQTKASLQDVPNRLPVAPGRLHDHIRDADTFKPRRHR